MNWRQLLLFLISPFVVINGLFGAESDTIRVLYIGNSFTYFNNMPDMVDSLAKHNQLTVWHYMHAPGGISVGDTGKESYAHMDNPVVYNLIRSKHWHFVVVQDNQGRFVLDSAVFPNKSRVIAGHLMLMDSVKYYHPCARMIWFAGWGLKNGQLPNWPSGISMINKLLVNYTVLNSTAKETIAPIGEAWKTCINQSTIDLWSPDEMHPSIEGSYLTALVLFQTMFQISGQNNTYNAGISSSNSLFLQNSANAVISSTNSIKKYNLNGVVSSGIQYNGKLHAPVKFTKYQWYLFGNKIPLATDSVYQPTTNGTYWVTMEDSSGCILKSCYLPIDLATSIKKDNLGPLTYNIYPNPFNNTLRICGNEPFHFEISTVTGSLVLASKSESTTAIVTTEALEPGVYIISVTSRESMQQYKCIKHP